MLKTILACSARTAYGSSNSTNLTKYMVLRLTYNICFRNEFNYGRGNKNKNKNNLLNQYQKIKQKQKPSKITSLKVEQSQVINSEVKKQQLYLQNLKVNCQGCNVRLQSKDNTKYGYINQKILNQAIAHNIEEINKSYGDKIKSKDAKILDFMHQVQQESGIKIFDEKTNTTQNLDNIQVLMRLEQKIDKYEESEQLLNRQKKVRKQILCFRCFSLKYHNRLPQQYDNNEAFTTDSTEFILNKITNRHKGTHHPIQYLYLIDAFDVIGTFQEWLFKRLVNQKLQISLVVNKVDAINKEYINQTALRGAVRSRLKTFLKNIFADQQEFEQNLKKIKIYFISCNSRDGMKKLKQNLEKNGNNIQLIGFPNTGKTTLLNILSKLRKSTSKIPGTTVKITEHNYGNNSKIKVYDMPGLYSQKFMYNLILKPSLKSILTWHKRIAPGLLTNKAFIYGGKIEIQDVRIIVFGHGGACQSTNKWFIDNYREFWKGLPEPSQLKIKKYEIDLEFVDGKTDDLQIAGYGFIGLRLCIPNIKKTTRKLTLFLPEKIQFGFRPSILSTNQGIFHSKSALTKKYMLQRLTIKQKQKQKKPNKQIKAQKQQETEVKQAEETANQINEEKISSEK